MPRPGLRRLGSRAQDPSIHSVYRTPCITVERRPSSPSASRALPCASRQPRPAPCRALKDGASCPCPLSAAPRASLPFTVGPLGEGSGRWTSKTLFRRTVDQSRPSRGRLATEPLAELGLVVRSPTCAGCRIDPDAPGSRHVRQLLDPPLREEQVGGGPPCRQVGRLSWAFVPRRLGSQVRATVRRWLIRVSGRPYARFTSGASPRHRGAALPTPPTTCAVEDAVRRSPELVELSPAEVSFESLRFGDRAR